MNSKRITDLIVLLVSALATFFIGRCSSFDTTEPQPMPQTPAGQIIDVISSVIPPEPTPAPIVVHITDTIYSTQFVEVVDSSHYEPLATHHDTLQIESAPVYPLRKFAGEAKKDSCTYKYLLSITDKPESIEFTTDCKYTIPSPCPKKSTLSAGGMIGYDIRSKSVIYSSAVKYRNLLFVTNFSENNISASVGVLIPIK